jgi:hypothetical protein
MASSDYVLDGVKSGDHMVVGLGQDGLGLTGQELPSLGGLPDQPIGFCIKVDYSARPKAT